MDSKVFSLILSAIGVVLIIIGVIVALSTNLLLENFISEVIGIGLACVGGLFFAFGIILSWKSR
jgi:hypothetical protein